MDAVVVVFAKPPLPGHAKTRLARTLGPDQAAALAAAFLQDTLSLVEEVGATAWISTDAPEHPVLRACTGTVRHVDQGTGDLGARIVLGMKQALEQAPIAVALGADSPGLDPQALVELVAALSDHDAVLGPAQDGGFWGLGLTRCPDELLAPPLPWSTAHACAAVAERLRTRGMSVAFGGTALDVDEEHDLTALRELLARHPGRAPHTRTALGR